MTPIELREIGERATREWNEKHTCLSDEEYQDFQRQQFEYVCVAVAQAAVLASRSPVSEEKAREVAKALRLFFDGSNFNTGEQRDKVAAKIILESLSVTQAPGWTRQIGDLQVLAEMALTQLEDAVYDIERGSDGEDLRKLRVKTVGELRDKFTLLEQSLPKPTLEQLVPAPPVLKGE